MTIIHKIDDFLYELFPGTDTAKLSEAIKRFYTIGPFEPKVDQKGDEFHITVDVDRIEADKEKYASLVSLAESGKYDEAKQLAGELIEDAPHISEYHRILGQVHSETGDQESAIDCLIDSLRWNPDNEWALIMMGNIFAKHRQDVETAMTYYNRVLEIKPDDYLALNNIAVQLMESGNQKQAKDTFEKARQIHPDYPNTLHGLALIAYRESDFQEAFDLALLAVRKNSQKNELYRQSLKLALQSAGQYSGTIDAQAYVQNFVHELTVKTDTDIQLRADDTIKTAATIQFAEVHNRDHHLVLYKPGRPAVEHLMIHELMHLAGRDLSQHDSQILTPGDASEPKKALMCVSGRESSYKAKKNPQKKNLRIRNRGSACPE
jgi:tetratricopeptide (TPR) repeat protein